MRTPGDLTVRILLSTEGRGYIRHNHQKRDRQDSYSVPLLRLQKNNRNPEKKRLQRELQTNLELHERNADCCHISEEEPKQTESETQDLSLFTEELHRHRKQRSLGD